MSFYDEMQDVATEMLQVDTHLGSGSSAIAAHYAGLEFVGIELEPDYFEIAKQRIGAAQE